MVILRIRRAETALADGRLDEAFEIARAEEIRAHRHGQRLVGRLARALVERGGEHLSAGRTAQALADCDKADKLAGNQPGVAELRAQIADAASAEHDLKRRQADAVAKAREEIERGQLSIGERWLQAAGSVSGQAEVLRADVAARRDAVDAALAKAQAALDHEDWGSSIDQLLEVKNRHPANERFIALAARAAAMVTRRAAEALDQGRLDLAASLSDRLLPLAGRSMEGEDVRRAVELCRQAADHLQRGGPRDATEVLRRLAAVRPGAGWVAGILASLEEVAERTEQLRGGPLGLLLTGPGRVPGESSPVGQASTQVMKPRFGGGRRQAGGMLPGRFMVQVDGVGSFLVLRDRRITIGPAASSRPADLTLVADAELPRVAIERTDDDYFLDSEVAVRVNDMPVTRKLLAGGDRLALSPRCRMRFDLPNAASSSAVLHLSGTRLPRGDARRVILLDREMILGPGPSAHVRADQLSRAVVLQVREGRLVCHTNEPVMLDDGLTDGRAGIPLGTSVRIGPVCLVVTQV